MTTKTEQIDALLNPPGRRPLNVVIASLQLIESALTTQDTVEVPADDLRTLLAAARYGRNSAETELARIWGSFG